MEHPGTTQVPPPSPGDIPPPPPPVVWPCVLGGVSMVLAAEMILSIAYIGLQFVQATLMGALGGGPGSPFSGPYWAWQMVQLGQHALRPVLGAVLLAAGYLTYRHKRAGRLLHWFFAVPAILLAVAFPLTYILTCPPQIRLHVVLWPLWNSTIAAAYPVFLLVWFARPLVRRHVEAWP